MKRSTIKIFSLLALIVAFASEGFAQNRGMQQRPSSSTGQRAYSGGNQERVRPAAQQPRQFNQQPSASQAPRPVRDFNSGQPRIQPNRPVRDYSNNGGTRPVPTQTPSSAGTANAGSQPRPARSNPRPFEPRVMPSSTPANNTNNRPPATAQSNNYRGGNNRNGNNNYRGGRSGNTYVYNNYSGNRYYSHGYYNTRPNVVYNAYNPSWRYNYYPRRNTIVTSFPFAYSTINFGGYGYRYYDGLFYQPYDRYYRVIAPPIGIYINVLPAGYHRIVVRDDPYYYYNGTYYNQVEDRYTVVAPPVGAIVESIPDGYETVVIDGETYYKVDNVQYKPVVQDNGEIWYEVIKVG